MCDYSFRILIVGDEGVGKSSLFGRFVDNRFFPDLYLFEVLTLYGEHLLEVAGKQVLLQIFDPPGEERFRGTLTSEFRSSDGVVIVYDSTSGESFRNVEKWVKEARFFCSEGVPLMLVGMKCDEIQKKEVAKEEASWYAEQRGLSFMEASAKNGCNVKEVFHKLAEEVFNRKVLKIEPLQDGQEKMEVDHDDGEDHVLPPSKRSKKEDASDC